MIDLSTERLERLLAEATPGPWENLGWNDDPKDADYMYWSICARPPGGGVALIMPMPTEQDMGRREHGTSPPPRRRANAELVAAVPDLATEVLRLRAALEFYANEENWRDGSTEPNFRRDIVPSTIERDGGKAARNVLVGL